MFGISGAIKGEKGKKTILKIVRARLQKDLLFILIPSILLVNKMKLEIVLPVWQEILCLRFETDRLKFKCSRMFHKFEILNKFSNLFQDWFKV